MTKNIKKLLIANRGEIAVRIQRACRKLGIQSIQICSQADRDAPFVASADEKLCIGPASAGQSYLDIHRIVAAARLCNADAVHPGYGFLSENAEFSDAVEAAGMIFVGPTGDVIRKMGDKISAKKAMLAAGVPCIPGYEGHATSNSDTLAPEAEKIGYPLIIKAAAGGGGRGMRVVREVQELGTALAQTREEARLAFGNPSVYLERYLEHPRHVELQVLADDQGNVIVLGERDCSLQRRHQKIIEEAPAPSISRDKIDALSKTCATACRAIGYRGAGTFEFLYEDGVFSFIEMNTRIQVEHPVTEEIYGFDLVAAQLRVANGEPLWVTQDELTPRGHALECRINAEDPDTFLPSPGTITKWIEPTDEGVRVETHCCTGSVISANYDSMIAKIICHADTRAEAINRMKAALDAFTIEGIATNVPLHRRLLDDPVILEGGMDIHYLEAKLEGRT